MIDAKPAAVVAKKFPLCNIGQNHLVERQIGDAERPGVPVNHRSRMAYDGQRLFYRREIDAMCEVLSFVRRWRAGEDEDENFYVLVMPI